MFISSAIFVAEKLLIYAKRSETDPLLHGYIHETKRCKYNTSFWGELPCIRFTFSTRIIARSVSGFVTDCPLVFGAVD